MTRTADGADFLIVSNEPDPDYTAAEFDTDIGVSYDAHLRYEISGPGLHASRQDGSAPADLSTVRILLEPPITASLSAPDAASAISRAMDMARTDFLHRFGSFSGLDIYAGRSFEILNDTASVTASGWGFPV